MRSPSPTMRRPSLSYTHPFHLTPARNAAAIGVGGVVAATSNRMRPVLVLVREAAHLCLRAAGVDDVLVFGVRSGRRVAEAAVGGRVERTTEGFAGALGGGVLVWGNDGLGKGELGEDGLGNDGLGNDRLGRGDWGGAGKGDWKGVGKGDVEMDQERVWKKSRLTCNPAAAVFRFASVEPR